MQCQSFFRNYPLYSCRIVILQNVHFLKTIKDKKYGLKQGSSQATPLHQSRIVIEIVPSKFTEKTRKEVHIKRFNSVQKLQAKTEHGKCILPHPVIACGPFKVHSQVTFQSHSTEHARVMLNQA